MSVQEIHVTLDSQEIHLDAPLSTQQIYVTLDSEAVSITPQDIHVDVETQEIHVTLDSQGVVQVTTEAMAGPPGPAGLPGATGPPGPPGTGGGTGSDSNYVYTQSSAAATWVITHNLGKYPSVSVVDTGGNVLEVDVIYDDLNSVRVGFGSPTSGKAVFN